LVGRIWWKAESVELLIARNPDPDSRLPYLLLLLRRPAGHHGQAGASLR
jgi:hypothetical protein